MIKGAIFDMDGLLVDTEPLWQKAEVKIFNDLEVPMSEEKCRSVMGLRIDEVVKYWYSIYPWDGKYPEEVILDIKDEVESEIRKGIDLLPGVEELLAMFYGKGLRLALASSSAHQIIRAVLDVTGIGSYFSEICSAESEVYGKPHPAIFLTTLSKIQLNPEEVLVFEDSFNGAIASKAARLKTVVVPADIDANDKRFDFADMKLRSLREFDESTFLRMQKSQEV
ncbi:MAG: hexitol phosphatase HxpB [Bacteroidales bacterium]|nr:hexitol phosphatase HxpB [Bacteroidales bacterium]MCF8332811.1 hexitol phosphatase HxpB [Bacteroidales bacterium]